MLPIVKNLTIKEEFILLDSHFQKNNIKYCLIKKSCLDAARYGELKIEPNDLHLAVRNLQKASKIIKNLKLKLKVHITAKFPNQIKQISFW